MKYKPFPVETRLYFVTSVLSRHRAIFYRDSLSLPVLQALDFYANRGEWRVFAYCLMPSHLHCLLQMTGESTIQKQMGELHKWTAHRILDALQEAGDAGSLYTFKMMASTSKDRAHRVWDDAIAKPVFTERYLTRLLEYVHNNPCNPPWNLVRNRADYRYSSARFYDRGEAPLIPIEDIRRYWFELV